MSSLDSMVAVLRTTALALLLGVRHALAQAPAEEDPGEAPPDDDPSLFQLDEIVVTASRDEEVLGDAPVATEVIDRERIERSGAETVAEMLEEQAGVDVFQDVRGQSVRLSGLGPEYTLVLVDGERAIGRVNGAVDLSRYQLDDIERIEIVRGASSALYGSDALAGVINIVARRAEWSAEARAAYGYQDRRRSNARQRFEGGPRVDEAETLPRDAYGGTYDLSGSVARRAERWDLRLDLGYHRLDGYDLDPRDAATNGASSQQLGGTLAGRLEVSDRTTVSARAGYRVRDTKAIELRGRVPFDRRTRTEELQVSIGPETRLPGGGTLKLTGYYTRFSDQFLLRLSENPPPTPSSRTTEQLGQASIRVTRPFGASHLLTAGYDAFFETLESERLERPGRRARLAPYVQHEWTISEAPYFVIVPGVRLDADSWFGAALSPKLSIRFDPHEKLVLRASLGRGFRAPDFRELLLFFDDNEAIGYVVLGNPDLRAETSWSVHGGVELRAHRRLLISASAHWDRVDDMITTTIVGEATSGATRYTYVNIDEARTQGASLVLRTRPVDAVELDLGYTFLDADDLTTGSTLPGRARHRLSASASYRHRRTGLGGILRSQLVGERPFYETGMDGEIVTVVAEPYLALDLRVERAFGEHVQLFVGVDNALNNGGAYLGVRPRTFYGGLSGRL